MWEGSSSLDTLTSGPRRQHGRRRAAQADGRGRRLAVRPPSRRWTGGRLRGRGRHQGELELEVADAGA
jgi:hypothetical protein